MILPMFKSLIRRKLTTYLQEVLTPAVASATATRVSYDFRRERLSEAAACSEVQGTRPMVDAETPIIVSLTTHGTRLYEVHLAIESIMQGTVKPHHIVLWLDDDDPRPLPVALQRQMQRGLTVRHTRPMRSYAKLVPSLSAFPEAHIVTIDDDIFYPADFLERLLETHAVYPSAVIANVIMTMARDDEGIPQGILDWPYIPTTVHSEACRDLFFEGFGGVFYPAGSMPPETQDETLFKRLCPTADDVWFNAMTRLAGTATHVCLRSAYDFIAAVNQACQDNALNLTNNSENRNDRQIRAVWQHFHLQHQ